MEGNAMKVFENELMGMLAHDLRSPLTSLKEAASMLEDDMQDEFKKENQRLLEITHLGVDKLIKMTHDLSYLHKLQARKLIISASEEKLDELWRDLAETSIVNKGWKGMLTVSETSLPALEVYRDLLRRIFVDLLNILQSLYQDPKIEVSLIDQEGMVENRLLATGKLRYQYDFDQAFESLGRFQDSYENGKVTFSGFELMIAREAMEWMQGSISVEKKDDAMSFILKFKNSNTNSKK